MENKRREMKNQSKERTSHTFYGTKKSSFEIVNFNFYILEIEKLISSFIGVHIFMCKSHSFPHYEYVSF